MLGSQKFSVVPRTTAMRRFSPFAYDTAYSKPHRKNDVFVFDKMGRVY